MGTEKQERHAHDHDVRPQREEPASTDMADIIKEEQAAKAASAHQRRHHHAKTAEDDFGKGAKSNIHSRILKVEVVDGQTQITMGAGRDQGVRPDMEGYIKAGDNMLTDFKVSWCNENTALATVGVSPRTVYEANDVVINSSSKPAPGQDMKGRILGNTISGDYVDIMIGLGGAHGVRHGMKGFMHAADSDLPYADFTIAEVHATVSHAYVRLNNLDEVHQHPMVTVNPASGGGAKPKPGAHHG